MKSLRVNCLGYTSKLTTRALPKMMYGHYLQKCVELSDYGDNNGNLGGVTSIRVRELIPKLAVTQ